MLERDQGVEPAPEVLTRLHNTAQNCFADPYDPAVLAEQRQRLWSIVEAACDHQDDDDAVQVLCDWADVVDYAWFQSADAPLPTGLTREHLPGVSRQRGWNALGPGSETLSDEMFNSVIELLKPFKLRELLVERARNFERHSHQLAGALRDFAAATPAAQWLQKLGTEGAKQTRLTPEERANREAAIFGSLALQVQQQHGTASGALFRSSPGVALNLRRGYWPLDEEPGRRRINLFGSDIASRLLRFAHGQLTSLLENKAATQARYEHDRDRLILYDSRGEPLSTYETWDITQALQPDSFGFHATYGGDNVSTELYTEAMRQAHHTTTEGVSAVDTYHHAISEVANSYVSVLGHGLNLHSASHLYEALDIAKRPPADAPVVEEAFYGKSDKQIPFRSKQIVLTEDPPPSEGSTADQPEKQKLPQSRTEQQVLRDQVEHATRQLVRGLGRLMTLPEEVPDEVIYNKLHQCRQLDPVVRCLGSLLQATDELSSDVQLTEQTRLKLAQSLDSVQALEELRGRPHPRDPERYSAQPSLLAVLSQALAPIAPHVSSLRRILPEPTEKST